MSHPIHQDLPPSTRLMEMIAGYFLSQAIAAAALCGVADALKDGPKTINELTLATNTHALALSVAARSGQCGHFQRRC